MARLHGHLDTVRHHTSRDFVVFDILKYVASTNDQYDAIISRYTLHDLTEDEKGPFLDAVYRYLNPGAEFVVGDLNDRIAAG